MKKPNILPGKREISYSHGHAHITRDGEPFVNLQLGREGRGLHAEGVHFKLAPDARLIAAAPAMAEALEAALVGLESDILYCERHPDSHSTTHEGMLAHKRKRLNDAKAALTLAGYEF